MSKDTQKETTLRQLYTELHKFGNNGDYDKAIKTANRILGIAANEEKALQCKVICLIQTSKFDEAIKYIEKNNMKDLVFEKAYCQYRNNQPELALKTIEAANFGSALPANVKELKAQIYYRLERFEECFDLYKDIIKNTTDDYDDERQTNWSAVAAQLVIEGSKKDVPEFEESTYELTYNRACALAGKQDFAEAERRLKQSEKMCREFLEEDGATEEDIANEIAIIKVQLAYCLQMQGRSKEASSIYIETLKNKPSDAALVAVASNNSVVINKEQNIIDSKKKMRAAMSDACEHKLTRRQKKHIAFNNALLSLFANQGDCQALATKLAAAYPDLEFQCVLMRAAQYAKDKKYKDGLDVLDKYVKGKAGKDEALAAKFAMVQLHLVSGNKKGAIDILQSLGEAKYRPGVVSALVSLFLGIDDKQKASEILKEAVDWYKKNKQNAGDLSEMWRQAATFHLRGGEAETAAKSLEELLKSNPSDVKILAQLVVAYAKFNPTKAQEVSKKLPALETMTTTAEIDALEATNWTMIAKAVKRTASKGTESPSSGDSQKPKVKKSKKKRKPRLPKFYDPSVKPDPERWLPKYERTGYRKKRDRRVKEVIKGSQGTASGQADQFDMSKNYNQNKSPATPLVQESAPGPRQQQRKNMHKKKKGRH
ncbi:signal recognition particle subunit SRP72 [Culicoides brevitarsis]|uniref:signal recognition particle subunit SRP72 n=1 Tax=Culicoides brevitarsis TaxID=469753 RepID=UPI00307BD179